MLVKHEEKIIDLIKKKESIAQLAAEIPEDCLQLIVDILDPPFPIETQEDKELMIFMYITSLIRYIYIDNWGGTKLADLFIFLSSFGCWNLCMTQCPSIAPIVFMSQMMRITRASKMILLYFDREQTAAPVFEN